MRCGKIFHEPLKASEMSRGISHATSETSDYLLLCKAAMATIIVRYGVYLTVRLVEKCIRGRG